MTIKQLALGEKIRRMYNGTISKFSRDNTKHFHLYVIHKDLGELLVIKHDGKISIKGKPVSMEEFMRFLRTYES